MIAATAPPACALVTFCSNVHMPRKIRAIWPVAEPAGSGDEQSSPEGSALETSKMVVVMGPGTGPLLEQTWTRAAPPIETLPFSARSLCTDPTLLTEI